MNKTDVQVLGCCWLLINLMAGYGAAKFFGAYAWIYVAFIVIYMKYVIDLSQRSKK